MKLSEIKGKTIKDIHVYGANESEIQQIVFSLGEKEHLSFSLSIPIINHMYFAFNIENTNEMKGYNKYMQSALKELEIENKLSFINQFKNKKIKNIISYSSGKNKYTQLHFLESIHLTTSDDEKLCFNLYSSIEETGIEIRLESNPYNLKKKFNLTNQNLLKKVWNIFNSNKIFGIRV